MNTQIEDRAMFYIPVADGMRALCVGIVGWYHIWQQSWLEPTFTLMGRSYTLLPLVRVGYIMVDLLLLLSGFLLFLPYARSRVVGGPMPSMRSFYRKRVTRVLPSYYLSILIVLFCFALPQREYHTRAELWQDLWTHLTMTHTFFRSTYQYTKLNVVLWTLAIEAQAYVVFPLLARAFAKKPLVTYLCMVIAGFAYRLGILHWGPEDLSVWVNQLPAFADVYANGMLAALLYVMLARRGGLRSPWLRAAATVGACLALWGIWQIVTRQSTMGWDTRGIHVGQCVHRFPLSALGALWLLLASQAFRGFQAVFGNRLMRFFAAISFQFYIWHQYLAVRLRFQWRFPPYVSEFPQREGEMPWQWQYTLVCFLLAAAVAAALTYGFEKPVARLLERKRHSKNATPKQSP